MRSPLTTEPTGDPAPPGGREAGSPVVGSQQDGRGTPAATTPVVGSGGADVSSTAAGTSAGTSAAGSADLQNSDTGPDEGPSSPAAARLRPGRHAGPDTDALLERLAELDDDHPERSELRNTIVTSHLPLVHHIARRFYGRGEPHDDVVQVGTIGLIKAVDRYEPGRGVPFAGYAVPTVTGEIRRYFRDRAGTVRLPRRVQEVQVAVTQARESLTHEMGRTPTVEEVSTRSGLDTDTVLEVLESAYSLTTVPLDVDNGVGDSLGEEDLALDEVLTRETLRPVLAKLEPRERRIIALRFIRGMSQAQIADEVGISQMHVSRLLNRTLMRLRADMTRPDTGD